jgi:hypothetical protein
MKNNFILYSDQEEIFAELPKDKAGELIIVVFEYVKTGVIPQCDSMVKIAFIPIKQKLDKDRDKYLEKCNKNRDNVMKRYNDTNVYERNNSYKVVEKPIYHISYINNYIYKILSKYILVKEKNKKEKKEYGEFKKVKLFDDEYKKLIDKLGEKQTQKYIDDLDIYLEQNKKKKYDSHYATILSWNRKDKKEGQAVQEKVPHWYGKEFKSEKMTKEEEKELRKKLEEFQ